jgi:hypothetical protein
MIKGNFYTNLKKTAQGTKTAPVAIVKKPSGCSTCGKKK